MRHYAAMRNEIGVGGRFPNRMKITYLEMTPRLLHQYLVEKRRPERIRTSHRADEFEEKVSLITIARKIKTLWTAFEL